MILLPNPLIFFVGKKMRKAFAVQKVFTFFQQKILAYFRYKCLNFNETLTDNVVSFEQPGALYFIIVEMLQALIILIAGDE